jgi:hypothetical protein
LDRGGLAQLTFVSSMILPASPVRRTRMRPPWVDEIRPWIKGYDWAVGRHHAGFGRYRPIFRQRPDSLFTPLLAEVSVAKCL